MQIGALCLARKVEATARVKLKDQTPRPLLRCVAASGLAGSPMLGFGARQQRTITQKVMIAQRSPFPGDAKRNMP